MFTWSFASARDISVPYVFAIWDAHYQFVALPFSLRETRVAQWQRWKHFTSGDGWNGLFRLCPPCTLQVLETGKRTISPIRRWFRARGAYTWRYFISPVFGKGCRMWISLYSTSTRFPCSWQDHQILWWTYRMCK